jgi:hypothetical protein
MATVSPRKSTRTLVEAQQHVRHPLERIRGTIRTYLGLEGVALLLTLLALWFWVTLALDYGPFRVFDLDWVQWVQYRWARALSLGILFLGAVVLLRMSLLRRLYGPESKTISSIAFASTVKRQTLPVWLRLPLVGAAVAVACWVSTLFLDADAANSAAGGFASVLTGFLGLLIGTPLVGLLVTGAHEWFGVQSSVSRLIRAPAAAVGCAVGAFVGVVLGALAGGPVGAIICSALLAMAGDVFGLLNVAVITCLLRGKGYLVALTVPCVAAYLLGWLVAGLLAGISPWLAATVVILLMVGPVIAVVALRLMRDFSDPALALVLERRFPGVLGDRLITAVELANPKKAARYGYSEVMIERTIHDAAELVDTVPVREVFDWKRLTRYFLGVIACTVGLYLLSAINIIPVFLGSSDSLFVPAVLGAVALNGYAFFAFSYLIFSRGHTTTSSVRFVAPAALFLLLQGAMEVGSIVTHGLDLSGPGLLAIALRLVVTLVVIAAGCGYILLRSRLGFVIDVPILLAALLGFGGLATARPGAVADYAKSFNDTAGLWMERDLFLQNTIWPRRAYLEVLGWPDSHDKHVGKDDSALSVKVRSYRWVVSSSESAEGWRPLTWNDLKDNRHILGEAVTEVDFRENDDAGKKDWGKPREESGWTLDEIETHLNRPETQNTIDADTNIKLRDVFAKLDQRAADPAMRRTLRKLIVPTQVRLRYRGVQDGGELTLQLQGDNEYTGQFPDLKDKVYFTARGEDYETARYWITVVAPPQLVEMSVDEERPAYMLYRATGDNPAVLRGLKQRIANRPVSTGGDTSRIESLPAGSNLVVIGKSTKELKEVAIDEPRKGAAAVKGDVQLIDPYTFQVRFDNVQTAFDFYFRFVDTENVKGERHVIIKPARDVPPDVKIDVKVLRKKGADYLVTPSAYIPLEAAIKDDRGLQQVEYACTVTKLDRQAEQSGRGLFVLGALHLLPGGPGQELVAASRIATLSREAKAGPKPTNETGTQHFPVPTFRLGADEFQPIEKIQAGLNSPGPLKTELKREFSIDRLEDRDIRNKESDPPFFFALDQVKNPAGERLKIEDRDAVQPRYKVQLWMEAADTDVETGAETLTTPRGAKYLANRGRSTNTIGFLVVPESELLAEIAKEEDSLYIKLGEQVKRLQDGLDKLDDMKRDLTVQGLQQQHFVAMQARADELKQTLEKGELTVSEVSSDYQRILKEMVTNRVEPTEIDRVQKQIVEPLNAAVNGDENDKKANDTFPRVRASIADLQTAVSGEGDLNAKVVQSRATNDEARLRLNGLIKRLNDTLDKMQQGIDLAKLKDLLRAGIREQERQKEVLKQVRDQMIAENLKGLTEDKP